LIVLLVDVGLTLRGQPAAYWAGDYARTTEGAPFYRMLYAWRPAAAVCGYLLWAGLLGGLLILLPEVLAVVLTIAVVIGPTVGAYSWLQVMLFRAGPTGWYQAANGLFLWSALTAGVGVRWAIRSVAPRGASGLEWRGPSGCGGS
jgi:hypothetical protein